MIQPSQISTALITGEMIGRAWKVFEGSTPVYKVQSSRDELVEYSVRWNKVTGFSCTCPAGAIGFSRCKAGVCQHVIIAVAAAREEREAVNELHRLIAEQAIQAVKTVETPIVHTTTVDAETLARVLSAPKKKASKAKAYEPRDFSTVLLNR